jgi:hypothetical protein
MTNPLEDLQSDDPEAVRRAEKFFLFGERYGKHINKKGGRQMAKTKRYYYECDSCNNSDDDLEDNWFEITSIELYSAEYGPILIDKEAGDHAVHFCSIQCLIKWVKGHSHDS